MLARLLTEHVRVKHASNASSPSTAVPSVNGPSISAPAAAPAGPVISAAITNPKELLTALFVKVLDPSNNADQVGVDTSKHHIWSFAGPIEAGKAMAAAIIHDDNDELQPALILRVVVDPAPSASLGAVTAHQGRRCLQPLSA